jgi:hypothetical protein
MSEIELAKVENFWFFDCLGGRIGVGWERVDEISVVDREVKRKWLSEV